MSDAKRSQESARLSSPRSPSKTGENARLSSPRPPPGENKRLSSGESKRLSTPRERRPSSGAEESARLLSPGESRPPPRAGDKQVARGGVLRAAVPFEVAVDVRRVVREDTRAHCFTCGAECGRVKKNWRYWITNKHSGNASHWLSMCDACMAYYYDDSHGSYDLRVDFDGADETITVYNTMWNRVNG